MNWKNFAIRFAGLIAIGVAAGPLVGLTTNILLKAGLIPEVLIDKAFGHELLSKCVYVWLTCLLFAFASIFLKQNWRYIFYFSPLYAPSVFAVVYTIMQ